MKKMWRIVLIIVIICFAVGAVSAAVGLMTGADFDRIGAALEERVAEKHNVDLNAFIHDWIPESLGIIRDEVIKK